MSYCRAFHNPVAGSLDRAIPGSLHDLAASLHIRICFGFRASDFGFGVGVGWAKANQWQWALFGRTVGQSPRTSNHQSASGGPPEYALQPADLASHGSRDQWWQNRSARCGRNGDSERIPVGRRWSGADVTSFRHRKISSAIHCTRPWSALAHPTTTTSDLERLRAFSCNPILDRQRPRFVSVIDWSSVTLCLC